MAITIELTTEQETRLALFARRQGLAPSELVQWLVTSHLPEEVTDAAGADHLYFTATPAQWEAAMDQLAAGNEQFPVLPDIAYDREGLYEDRF